MSDLVITPTETQKHRVDQSKKLQEIRFPIYFCTRLGTRLSHQRMCANPKFKSLSSKSSKRERESSEYIHDPLLPIVENVVAFHHFRLSVLFFCSSLLLMSVVEWCPQRGPNEKEEIFAPRRLLCSAKTLRCTYPVHAFLQLLGAQGYSRAISCLLTHDCGTRPAAITRL